MWILLPLLATLASPAHAGSVYVNGVQADGLRDFEFNNVKTVRVDGPGGGLAVHVSGSGPPLLVLHGALGSTALETDRHRYRKVGVIHSINTLVDDLSIAENIFVIRKGVKAQVIDAYNREDNHSVHFADGRYRGYLRLELDRNRLDATLIGFDSVRDETTASARTLAEFHLLADQPGLRPS